MQTTRIGVAWMWHLPQADKYSELGICRGAEQVGNSGAFRYLDGLFEWYLSHTGGQEERYDFPHVASYRRKRRRT